MLDKLLDTESICWRDPSFFSEEALLQRALPYLDLLVNDLWAAQTIAPDRGILKNLALVRDLRSMPGWNMAQWKDGFVALQNLHRFWERNAADSAGHSKRTCSTSRTKLLVYPRHIVLGQGAIGGWPPAAQSVMQVCADVEPEQIIVRTVKILPVVENLKQRFKSFHA